MVVQQFPGIALGSDYDSERAPPPPPRGGGGGMLSFVNVYVEVAGPFALDSVTLCDDLLSNPYLVVGSFGPME